MENVKAAQVNVIVQDIVENSTKSVHWFMKKYGLNYEEWSYLNRAALVAATWKEEARQQYNRCEELLGAVRRVIWDIHEHKLTDPVEAAAILEQTIRHMGQGGNDDDEA